MPIVLYLKKTNVTAVCTLLCTLFPVSVVSVCAIYSRISFFTTWTLRASHALFAFRSISTVAAW